MENLDTDLLRSFVAIAETGSMTEGAAQIGRTQSAASLQIKRLETLLGAQVFDRHARGVAPTALGRRLLPVAREVTATLDSAYRQLTADALGGHLRLGIPDDHTQGRLTRIISHFAQSHPQVELEVTCALSAGFPNALARGALDLAVYEVEHAGPGDRILMRDPTAWMMRKGCDVLEHEPLPVALFDQACWWRDVALAALDTMSRPYRVVYSSQSVAGVTAAIEAGIAVGLLGTCTPGTKLVPVPKAAGFPDMPVSTLVLASATEVDDPAARAMTNAIETAFGHSTTAQG